MGLQTNTQPHSWTTGASSSFVNLTATNFNLGTGYLTNCLNIQPNTCIFGDRTTCVIGGNIAHTLIDSTSSIKTVRGSNTASGYYSLVAGGSGNTVTGNCAAIVGGATNVASGNRSFIGGGYGNTASNSGAVVLAGRTNTASGSSSFIGTGTNNVALTTDSLVLGGVTNSATNTRAAIINGCINLASGDYSTVIGGYSNSATNTFTFIGNGKTNTASGIYTVVVGGSANKAAGSYNIIGGGLGNNTSSGYTVIDGGKCNTVSNNFSVVVGGSANNVSGTKSGILGGSNNTLTHNDSFIVGSNITSKADNTLHANNVNVAINLSASDITSAGYFYGNGYYLNNLNPANLPANYTHCWSIGTNAIQPVTPAGVTQNNAASGICSGIYAGGCNTIGAAAAYSYIGAGRGNTANSPYSTVVGGSANCISTGSAYSYIGGGSVNSLSSANTTIVGGWSNSINTNSGYGTIAGGAKNTVSGTYSVVVGGSYNTVTQPWAAVNGGSNNTASGYLAGVNGGDFNTASGVGSVVVGGHRNIVTGGTSFIAGGYYNTVNGWFASVGGGSCNTINNNFASIIGGNANVANAANTFILGSNLSATAANYTYVNNLAVNTNSPNKTLTVVGDISATGALYASSIDRLSIPTSYTFTGDGSNTIFDTNNSIINTTPASYVVSLNGASQVPIVDYNVTYTGTPGVSTNKIVTTFIPANGSTLSVIALNTSTYGLADGTITLNKLATNTLSAIVTYTAAAIGALTAVSTVNLSGTTTFNNISATGLITTPVLTVSSSLISTSFNNASLTVLGAASGSLFNQIQNTNSGASASTDIALYNDSGISYIDIGINSTSYNGSLYSPTFNVVSANDGYIFNVGGNLGIGTSSTNNGLIFFTGGTTASNTRMVIASAGNVGIGTTVPNSKLTVVGDISATGNVYGNTGITVLPAATTTYALQPSDSGTTIASLNNTAGLTATITGTYPAGYQVALLQLSGGRINVNGGTSINNANSYFKTNKQYSAATLIYTGATAGWVLFGDLNS